MHVLVVGGAGYIGSHCVRQLVAAGHRPVVLDNLVFGHRAAVSPEVPFHQAALGDEEAVGKILAGEKIDVVMHFAAFAYVGESVTDPLKYYFNNSVATLHLLRAMLRQGVTRFVFSSTCATYGVPASLPIVETTPQAPINPYGQTKLDVENALKALARAHGLSFAAFRYFNAAGAAADGRIGEDHDPETHLIPLAIDAAVGRRPALHVFGTDYDTPDGTCLRDYVHVDDLSRAHIAVFDKLAKPGAQLLYNLGTGTPTSVRQVIAAVEKVVGKPVPHVESPRRAGDPPALYADASKARTELNWLVKYPDIESIVASAWRWHRGHPNGYGDRQNRPTKGS
jgi:UDP-glucose 4-epimerase